MQVESGERRGGTGGRKKEEKKTKGRDNIRGGPARRQAESACMGASWLASWSSWIGQLWLLQDTRVNNPL